MLQYEKTIQKILLFFIGLILSCEIIARIFFWINNLVIMRPFLQRYVTQLIGRI